jgi:hypothetical protein
MYCFFIRAHNSKGKHFDINDFAADSIMLTMYQSANARSPLPEGMQKSFRSLNEMYLSFMDPNGEIILFQLFETSINEVEAKMYFKAGSERRELVFQTGYGDDFAQGHWRFLKERPIEDRFDFSKEYDLVFHESHLESPLDRYRKMYAENGMLKKMIVKKAHNTPEECICLHEKIHKAESKRIVDFGHCVTDCAKELYSKKDSGIIRKNQ